MVVHLLIAILMFTRTGLRPEGDGEHHFFGFHICDRAAADK